MLILNPTPGGSGSGGAIKSVHYPPLVKFADNKAIGMSQDDASNNALGTLYPTNLNTSLTSQSAISALYATEALQYYAIDDDQYDVNESKLKVAEAFFSKYKKLNAILYSSFTSVPKPLLSTTLYLNNIFRVEWLTSTKFAILYMDQSSGYVLKVVIGTIGSDGLTTWGTPAVAKTYTDATHANYACASMTLTDTDKLLVTYSNKVSTSYYLKARIMAVSGSTVTPQSEGADNTNYGTSAPYTLQAHKIRGASGAGAVILITPNTSGTTTPSRVVAVSHDSGNAITYGGVTVVVPSTDSSGALALYSYATDRIMVVSKQSGTNHVYAQLYSISGVTVTAIGSPLQITTSTSSQHYLPQKGHNAFIDFGSSILGLVFNPANNGARIYTFSVASDVLSLIDDAQNTSSQMSGNSTANDNVAITRGNNTGLVYGQISSGGNPLVTWSVSYVGGRALVQSYSQIYHDLGSGYPAGVFPSPYKTLFINTNTNVGQNMTFQIGAGDSVIQVLDSANAVLATITETNDGPAETKLKSLNLTLANTPRMIFKLKNTSGQARLIKVQAVYATVE